MHTGDRCYAVQCITTLSNVDDSCSHAIFWNHRFVLQQLLKTRVISSSSEAFWGVIPFSAFFLCFCFFVASAVVWCLTMSVSCTIFLEQQVFEGSWMIFLCCLSCLLLFVLLLTLVSYLHKLSHLLTIQRLLWKQHRFFSVRLLELLFTSHLHMWCTPFLMHVIVLEGLLSQKWVICAF